MIARSKSTTNSWKERAKKNWRLTVPMFTKRTRTCDMSRIRLAYTVLRAPFNGVVLVRQAELGEVVSPGTPIVTLGDLDHLWVRVYVPETDLGKVHWGQAVDVRTDSFPDKTYPGRDLFHLFGSGIHSQERADGKGTRHAGLPGQSGRGESQPRAEAGNAGRRSMIKLQ